MIALIISAMSHMGFLSTEIYAWNIANLHGIGNHVSYTAQYKALVYVFSNIPLNHSGS